MRRRPGAGAFVIIARHVRADLHFHSNASDGVLAPEDVVARAAANGAQLIALTDHDDVRGLAQAREAAVAARVRLIDAVEISVTWESTTVHVVGLAIDPKTRELVDGLAAIREGRDRRARRIAEALEAIGIRGALDGACRHAESSSIIGRNHFARFLVEAGAGKDVRTAFESYLGRGRPGYVAHTWASLPEAIGWIAAAGGMAVLAHPGRYRIGAAQRDRLFAQFRDLGGRGVEVVSGAHAGEQVAEHARCCRRFGLLASCGSDFHSPSESVVDVGTVAPLPEGLRPVWSELA